VAEIAKKARPGLLILYHRANPGGVGRPNPEQVLLEEVRQLYGGKVVIGHDLDVFSCGREGHWNPELARRFLLSQT
jgi:ribonuclease BN (tRNA processing enzyme)